MHSLSVLENNTKGKSLLWQKPSSSFMLSEQINFTQPVHAAPCQSYLSIVAHELKVLHQLTLVILGCRRKKNLS
jgi:hypothetical protein